DIQRGHGWCMVLNHGIRSRVSIEHRTVKPDNDYRIMNVFNNDPSLLFYLTNGAVLLFSFSNIQNNGA
ncbi:hypothetical protein, partial [Methanospirillum sp.]|uniref:hypothetical protein n=1 Tax=Methanospirillum sp. TaxID=45200 RepID=UPI002B7D5330